MQEDYSDADAISEESDSEWRWVRTQRSQRFFTAALTVLAAGLAGVVWYMYPILERHDVVLSQIPLTLTDVQRDMFSLGEQTKATNAKVENWSSRQEDLRGQLNKARTELMARIDSATKQASDASAALTQRVWSEVSSQLENIKAQLARLQASNEGGRTQIAGLQQELAQVRSQVNQQGQELARVHGQVDRNAIASEPLVAAVKTTPDKFALKRVDFEVISNHGTQVAPGILLEVISTEVSAQQISGSISVIPDGRTIRLQQLKVQEPVFLTSSVDNRTRKLVITGVSTNGATGYLLVPAQSGTASHLPAE
ncbi:MAG: hypothetical protein JWO19_2224 [Bryobacterales bacterium]|nr:hypothetical protein [Bryobacterales bacterium]